MTLNIRYTDEIGGAILLFFVAVMYLYTEGFPGGFGATSPAFFPRVIGGLIAFFAIVQIVRGIRSETVQTREIERSVLVTVAAAAGLIFGYVVLLPFLGFLIGTIAFLIVSMHFSGVERARRSVPVALVVTLVLFYIFDRFLRVPLPENPFVPISRLLPYLYGGVGLA